MPTPLAVDPDFADAARGGARVLGLMSGTSLDGLDLCLARVTHDRSLGQWSYELNAAETVPYDAAWRTRLEAAYELRGDASGLSPKLAALDRDYGRYLGERAAEFLRRRRARADLVASHGHTVHHRPAEGYTLQVGDGRQLAAACGLQVVADFRTADVRAGGHGAPLVPLADEILFGGYAQCLNLGGFANVSYAASDGRRVAYDITAANGLLDRLSRRLGHDYDADGALAQGGRIDRQLSDRLAGLAHYRLAPPKSLGREWLEDSVWPLFGADDVDARDALATATAHVAAETARALAAGPPGEVLVTGGGAHNGFLVASIRARLSATHRLTVPDRRLVDFKEALAFALLGARRVRGEATALASVTGARRDTVGGVFAQAPSREENRDAVGGC